MTGNHDKFHVPFVHNSGVELEKSFPECGDWAVSCAPPPAISVNRTSLHDVSRQRVADLIRAAFPSYSDKDTARIAARYLGYSERTVTNWLDKTHGAPFDAVFAIGCLIGVFRVMEVMTRDQSRSQVLSLIICKVRNAFRR